jgi:ankyrin repeat protein
MQSDAEAVAEAAKAGDVAALTALLDAHPEELHARTEPYEWTLLHHAAAGGHLAAVEALLARGLDVNAREVGDNTYALHWAAAGGCLEIVRRLVDAGGDVVGSGDDHALEVIGWATCWDPCHGDVADFLVSRGAHHHIFSAIATDRADELRRIVAADPGALSRRMSRHEDHRLPLHFAVGKQRAEMVALLVELGADPLAVDASGHSPTSYATAPGVDRAVLEAIRALTLAELDSARRGRRVPNLRPLDFVAALGLSDWELAESVQTEGPGPLHLMAKRGAVETVEWLLAHGADPNARWNHWNTELTPLHLAAAHGHTEVTRVLLEAGANPRIRDTFHESDALGWATHFGQSETVALLGSHI